MRGSTQRSRAPWCAPCLLCTNRRSRSCLRGGLAPEPSPLVSVSHGAVSPTRLAHPVGLVNRIRIGWTERPARSLLVRQHGKAILSLVCRTTRRILSALAVAVRHDASKDTELLVLRKRVIGTPVPGTACRQPCDPIAPVRRTPRLREVAAAGIWRLALLTTPLTRHR